MTTRISISLSLCIYKTRIPRKKKWRRESISSRSHEWRERLQVTQLSNVPLLFLGMIDSYFFLFLQWISLSLSLSLSLSRFQFCAFFEIFESEEATQRLRDFFENCIDSEEAWECRVESSLSLSLSLSLVVSTKTIDEKKTRHFPCFWFLCAFSYMLRELWCWYCVSFLFPRSYIWTIITKHTHTFKLTSDGNSHSSGDVLSSVHLDNIHSVCIADGFGRGANNRLLHRNAGLRRLLRFVPQIEW